MALNDLLAVLLGVLLGVLASVPVALVIAASVRQPRDVIDFTGWIPPDEISEETAVTLYFDVAGREVI
jgi:hypothetical protein